MKDLNKVFTEIDAQRWETLPTFYVQTLTLNLMKVLLMTTTSRGMIREMRETTPKGVIGRETIGATSTAIPCQTSAWPNPILTGVIMPPSRGNLALKKISLHQCPPTVNRGVLFRRKAKRGLIKIATL